MKMRGVARGGALCAAMLCAGFGARVAPAQAGATAGAAPGGTAAAAAPAKGQASSAATIDPAMHAKIVKLIDITHAMERMDKMWGTITTALRPAMLSGLPNTANREKIADELLAKIGAAMHSPEAMDGMVALYAAHLPPADVDAAIAFYSTPAGADYLRASEEMTPDAMKWGQETMLKAMPGIMKSMCDAYPELQDSATTCPGEAKKPTGELRAPGFGVGAGAAPAAGSDSGK